MLLALNVSIYQQLHALYNYTVPKGLALPHTYSSLH